MDVNFWSFIAQPVQHDTNYLAFVSRGVLVLAAGDVNYITAGGSEDTLSVSAAMLPYIIPCFVRQIKATATTVADTDMRIGR
jgi:hypothetical protein